MLKNYLLVALRNFRQNKLFSLINVLGLAIGISASLVIFLIVRYDFSFDRFEPDGDRIYRVVSDHNFSGTEGHSRGTQAPLADVAKKELTGPDLVVSFRYYQAGKLSVPAPSPTVKAATTKPATFKTRSISSLPTTPISRCSLTNGWPARRHQHWRDPTASSSARARLSYIFPHCLMPRSSGKPSFMMIPLLPGCRVLYATSTANTTATLIFRNSSRLQPSWRTLV